MNENRQQFTVLAEQLVEALEGMAGAIRNVVEAVPDDDEDSSRSLTVAEAAKRIGMSERWLYKHAGNLPFAKRMGRAVRFDDEGLMEWWNNRNEKQTQDARR